MIGEAEGVSCDVLCAAFGMACRALAPRLDEEGLHEFLEAVAVDGETEATRFLAVSLLAVAKVWQEGGGDEYIV